MPPRSTAPCGKASTLTLQHQIPGANAWDSLDPIKTGDASAMVVDGLAARTMYAFRLVEADSLGDQSISESVLVMLGQGDVSRWSNAPRATPAGPGNVRVSWEHLASGPAQCRVAAPTWTIAYRAAGGDAWNVVARAQQAPHAVVSAPCVGGCTFRVAPEVKGWNAWSSQSKEATTTARPSTVTLTRPAQGPPGSYVPVAPNREPKTTPVSQLQTAPGPLPEDSRRPVLSPVQPLPLSTVLQPTPPPPSPSPVPSPLPPPPATASTSFVTLELLVGVGVLICASACVAYLLIKHHGGTNLSSYSAIRRADTSNLYDDDPDEELIIHETRLAASELDLDEAARSGSWLEPVADHKVADSLPMLLVDEPEPALLQAPPEAHDVLGLGLADSGVDPNDEGDASDKVEYAF